MRGLALLEYHGDILALAMHKEGLFHHFRDFFLSSFGCCLPIRYPRLPRNQLSKLE